MDRLVAAAIGLILVGGVLAIIRGFQRTAPSDRPPRQRLAATWVRVTRRPIGRAGRRRDATLLAGILVGFGVAALSGWLIAILAIPVLALGLPYLLALPKPRDVELLEALDRWVRSLTATLTTGKSVTDAIEPYRTPIGQLILSVLVCLYLGSLILMRRRAQQRPRQRILVGQRL
jgi:tight adherence protein B